MRTLALLLAVVLSSGCFTVRHSYDGDKFLTGDPSVPGVPLRVVGHFEAHDRQFFWLHGGLPRGEPLNGAALAAAEAEGHAGVVNLSLRDGQNFTDAFITHIPSILSLLCGTWSVWVEGDVVDTVDVVSEGGAR